MDLSRICGVWLDDEGALRIARATSEGQRVEEVSAFNPFAWADASCADSVDTPECTPLAGDGRYDRLLRFESIESYFSFLKGRPSGTEFVRGVDAAFLMHHQARYFEGMSFLDLRRCQLDIETSVPDDGSFPDPRRKEDRVIAIGMQFIGDAEPVLLEIEERSDAAERALLKQFAELLRERDPDVIEGHNIFGFDLDYLARRGRRYKLDPAWGRFGAVARFRKSRLRVAERWIDFPRCEIPGRTVFDTLLAVQLYDITARDLSSYGLKDVAIHFGITVPEDERTYLQGHEIHRVFDSDRERFREYLKDDLRETRGVADRLLPTYVAQAANFPLPLQEICLRGTGMKVDLLLLEKYYHAQQSLPEPSNVKPFAGGFTKSFETGVFRHILHFDVASLYPSLLLHIGRNPANDSLGIFIPLLEELRAYRLKYKKLAQDTDIPELAAEYGARQASYKILINSFYGYLGFQGARFADGDLAAEVTARGRDLLQKLIARFQDAGCIVLEADTDGIYLSSESYWDQPETLLAEAADVLPEGIQLEFDGRYEAMFCYKAKNYALFDGRMITVRGSALRSRGTEPFLKHLTDTLIAFVLGASDTSPQQEVARLREEIDTLRSPVEDLAKSEYLSMSPEAYQKKIEKGGKPRRASLEAALQMERKPGAGERVTFFIRPKEKGETADWQRAIPIEKWSPETMPYDPAYYLKKLKDWQKRYAEFLEIPQV